MKNILKKSIFLLYACAFANIVSGADITVDLKTTSQVTPSEGELIYNPAWKSGNASANGLKLGSTNNFVGWILDNSTFSAATWPRS